MIHVDVKQLVSAAFLAGLICAGATLLYLFATELGERHRERATFQSTCVMQCGRAMAIVMEDGPTWQCWCDRSVERVAFRGSL